MATADGRQLLFQPAVDVEARALMTTTPASTTKGLLGAVRLQGLEQRWRWTSRRTSRKSMMHHQSAGEEARHLQRTSLRKSMMHHQSAGEEARCHQQSPLRAPAQLRGRGARWLRNAPL